MPLLSEDDLCRSPRWFPLRFAERSIGFVELDEDGYRAASFLDERLLTQSPPQACGDLGLISSAGARLASQAYYLFHIGHVGSTLVSRLIGAHAGVLSVREPALLRAFADPARPPAGLSIECLLALLSRTWHPAQRAVIKATSIVNEAAETILGSTHRPAAVFIYATPLNYLRGILAGPNSRVESKALASGRWRRLQRRIGAATMPPLQTEGEWIAMSWLSEMTALHQTASRFEAHVLWTNFDEFLRDPAAGLHHIFGALGVDSSEKDIETLITGPIMRQYSKAPEHGYDAALRHEVLQSSDWEHGAEIRLGLDWLAQAAARSALVEAVLVNAARRGNRA